MLKDLQRFKTDNLGGINSYIFIPVESVVYIPPVMEGAVRMGISIKPGTRWYRGYGTPYTMRFSDEQQSSDHGEFFSKKISGVIPKNRAHLVDQYTLTKNRSFIVIVTDNNEKMFLVGTKEEPLRFMTKTDSKTNVPERNEISWEFYGDCIEKSPEFTGLCPLLSF